MSTTATHTMVELKVEPQHGSLWAGYASPVATAGRYSPHSHASTGMVAPASSTEASDTHLVRPPSRHGSHSHTPLDHAQQQTSGQHHEYQQHHQPPLPPSHSPHSQPNPHYHHRPSIGEAEGLDRYSHAGMVSIPSINNLKRRHDQMEQQQAPPASAPPYTEIVQDLRDDYSKPSQDGKLLSFRKTSTDKLAIVDSRGRLQEIEVDAQLHGMFFLSELSAANTANGGPGSGSGSGNGETPVGAELTCYRRNLFQISGNVTFPYSQLSVLVSPDTGEATPIKNTELSISATESVDGHPVRLIVIPWKTPPPNSPDVLQGPDQEPAALPLIPCQDPLGTTPEDAVGDEYAVHPIGWRRLQFRM
jgi:hypothetical protein